MRNYAETCKRTCSYNLEYNFLTQLLPLQSSIFVMHFSNAFLAWEQGICKVKSLEWNCSSLCNLSFAIF